MQPPGMAALVVVARHIGHLAVVAAFEPGFEPLPVTGQVGVGDADLLKAEFPPPAADIAGQGCEIEGGGLAHSRQSISAARSSVLSSLQKQKRICRAPGGSR